ncbi:MAG: helix-turn-helix domain-containing protein [Betaproteobacteria bacterium]|nr:MAG: helix-turn-helix domain-containing protein [Betaproteobacteria bacterium]
MAWQHIHLVRELDLPHVEKLVLFALASRVDDRGGCWPSVATLRKDTGLAHRTVQYRLRSLVARGLVSCEERRGATTVLRLHLCEPCLSAAQPGVQDTDEKARTVHAPVHDVHATDAPAAPEVKKELPLNRHEERRGDKLSTTHASNAECSQAESGSPSSAALWWTTHAGIDQKGRELQLPPRPGEPYSEYKHRLFSVLQQRRSR